jgi:Undecaprenyl-phosphate glucose phosphotransferase
MNFSFKSGLGTGRSVAFDATKPFDSPRPPDEPTHSDSLKVPSRKPAQWTISYRAVGPAAMALDAVIIISTGILSGVAYHLETIGISGPIAQFGGFASVVAVLFIAMAQNRDLYDVTELLSFKSQIREIAIAWLAILLFLTGVAFTMKVGEDFSRGATLIFATSGLAALVCGRVFWRIFLADGLSVRRFSGREIMLIEESPSDSALQDAFERHGLKLSQHFVLPADRSETQRRKSIIAQAVLSARGSKIEEIVVSANLDQWSELKTLLSQLRVLPIPVSLVPVGPVSDLLKVPSHTIGDTVSLELQRGPRTLLERSVKRVLDIIIAVTASIVLAPLFLVTAIAIKLDSPGPIIFRQRRCGFNGIQFQILKFRTMSVLEDGDSIIQARPNDIRVTRVGAWLRRTSIDELPQLLNVLAGSMSIVGPRPHAIAHDDQFEKIVGNYAYRSHVKPGLTGWAQVNGYRGQTRTVADIEGRLKLDLWYIDNWTLLTDFRIILMTVIEIFRNGNVY